MTILPVPATFSTDAPAIEPGLFALHWLRFKVPPLIFAWPVPPFQPKPNIPVTDTVPPFMMKVPSPVGSKPIHRCCPKLADPPFSTIIRPVLFMPTEFHSSGLLQTRLPPLVMISVVPVSYTHLTLPTSDLV